jgi:hypothetical protein
VTLTVMPDAKCLASAVTISADDARSLGEILRTAESAVWPDPDARPTY